MRHDRWSMLAVLLLSIPSCGGEGAVGDACDESGAEEGECEEGALCGKLADDSEELECLTICKGDEDCPSDRACKGVSGTDIKGCRAKDVIDPK